MINFKYAFMVLSVLCFFLVACGQEIPVNEMTMAKKAIGEAKSVKADQYASDELSAAEAKLFEAHNLAVDEKMGDAKKKAEEAKLLAENAYETAVPLLAADTIRVAEKSLNKAEIAGAEILAKDEYRQAENKLGEAHSLFDGQEFYDSYVAAATADEMADNSGNLAIGRKVELENAILEVRATLDEARIYGAEEKDPETYNLAVESLGDAEASYNDLKLKQGFSEVEIAKLNADQVYMIALSSTAKERVAESSTILERAGESAGAEIAVDELEAASEANENARMFLVEGKYREAISSADESIRLATIVMNTEKSEVRVAKKADKPDRVDANNYWIYTVQYREKISEKDCLWFIADDFYKNPRKWPKIYEANKDLIKNPDLIQPGWELKVPKPEK